MSDTLSAARRDLVTASHILAHHGIVDAFGHASVRHPHDPALMLMTRSMAPALAKEEDVMILDLAGHPQGDGRAPFLERFIHGEIYREHKEVGAVVHSHAPSVLPFTLVEQPLRAAYHMAGFLGVGVPIFEIADAAGGDSDMLIRDPALGAALADRLADHAAVLMRGHGVTVVGRDLRQAVFRAVFLEINAQVQATAMRIGTPRYLSAGEAARADAANDGQSHRAWALWCRTVSER